MKLVPHLVPKPLWGKSAFRLFGKRALWKRMRTDAMEDADHTCQVCALSSTDIRLSCHELWNYDDEQGTATLVGLRMQCDQCDAAVHMGPSVAHGGRTTAMSQLCKVNGIGAKEAQNLFRNAMTVWRTRNKKTWRIAVAQPLLERYPQLAELLEWARRETD